MFPKFKCVLVLKKEGILMTLQDQFKQQTTFHFKESKKMKKGVLHHSFLEVMKTFQLVECVRALVFSTSVFTMA